MRLSQGVATTILAGLSLQPTKSTPLLALAMSAPVRATHPHSPPPRGAPHESATPHTTHPEHSAKSSARGCLAGGADAPSRPATHADITGRPVQATVAPLTAIEVRRFVLEADQLALRDVHARVRESVKSGCEGETSNAATENGPESTSRKEMAAAIEKDPALAAVSAKHIDVAYPAYRTSVMVGGGAGGSDGFQAAAQKQSDDATRALVDDAAVDTGVFESYQSAIRRKAEEGLLNRPGLSVSADGEFLLIQVRGGGRTLTTQYDLVSLAMVASGSGTALYVVAETLTDDSENGHGQ